MSTPPLLPATHTAVCAPQVDTEWLPSHLAHLTQLESLSWDGEGPFEDPDAAGEWGRALAPLHQLTYLRWQPQPPEPGAPAW